MIQGAILSDPSHPAMQRTRGDSRLSVAVQAGRTQMRDLYQSGAARILLPHSPARLEAVFLNTSGGLTSGDRIGFALQVGAGASVTGTTQTAERAYLATMGPATMTVAIDAGERADVDWLPQETILFQGADLTRTTRVDLGDGACCLMLETVVLGRLAMKETVTQARLTDRRAVYSRGRPLHVEALALTPETLRESHAPAVLGGALAFATLALCGPAAQTATDALRAIDAPPGVTAAASGWNGRALLRAAAADPWPLRLYLGRVIARLTGRPVPRVWQLQDFAQ